jgi:5-methylcytosine-specific restriction endonuclease McrA
MTKICFACKKAKSVADFTKNCRKPDGLEYVCRVCLKIAQAKNYLKHREGVIQRTNAYRKAHLTENRQAVKRYKRSHPGKIREYLEANYEILAAWRRNWFRLRYSTDRGLYLAQNAARRAARLQATPAWLSEEQKNHMVALYKACPKGFHVDHIVPLKGKQVCGLHVPWNLQYLSSKENLKKGNRY